MAERLTSEQASVIDYGYKGYNVLTMGKAGVGKSLTIQQLREQLGAVKTIVLTGPTGVAAGIINGQTYHSAFGIGIGQGTKEQLLDVSRTNKKAREILELENLAIIFDEMSMISAEMFDTLDYIARNIRKRIYEPFGGIQIFLFGDMHQLSPFDQDPNKAVHYIFHSKVWAQMFYNFTSPLNGKIVVLSKIFRQRDDADYMEFLDELRVCRLTDRGKQTLLRLSNPFKVEGEFADMYTRLYCTREEVGKENDARLAQLPGEPIYYEAKDTGAPTYLSGANCYFIVPDKLYLKKGAPVMLLKNMSDIGIINGSLGKVIGFEKHIDKGVEKNYPVVRFTDGQVLLLKEATWDIRNSPRGKPVLTRKQIPLALAYATTIHKAQGLTLERVIADMRRWFTVEQPYVAATRARSSKYIQIINFNLTNFRPNVELDEFDAKILGIVQTGTVTLYRNPQQKSESDDEEDDLTDDLEFQLSLAGD